MNAAGKAKRIGEKRQERRRHVHMLKVNHLGRFAHASMKPQRQQEHVVSYAPKPAKQSILGGLRRMFTRQKTV